MYCLPSTLTNINVLGKQYMQFRFVNICECFLDNYAWIGRFETVVGKLCMEAKPCEGKFDVLGKCNSTSLSHHVVSFDY